MDKFKTHLKKEGGEKDEVSDRDSKLRVWLTSPA